LTVPNSSTVARSAGGYADRSGRAGLVCSCNAVLVSTLRISVTCSPFGPGPKRPCRHLHRTSYAPGFHAVTLYP